MSIEDRAQEHEAMMWEARNVNRRHEPDKKKPGDAGYGPEECEDCGAEIPELRRAYGYARCTACQTVIEARRSGRHVTI